ncbi:MAG TPA: enoyl-CoA hydratase-related protein [Myxococcales bacterium]
MAEILIERLERVEIWTLNRPEVSNAISRVMAGELAANVERVSEDRSLSVVVVTGAGERAFCAGADLKERRAMSEDDVHAFLAELRNGLRSIEQSERVFVAAINGFALGGGTELALACDLRVAAPGAKLGLTEVSLGIIPGGGGTQRLARLIGPGRAKDLVLTGRQVSSEEAYALGLINRMAERRTIREEALLLAHAVAKNAPIALGAAKRAIDRGLDVSLEEGLTLEQQEYQRTLGTKDRLEGLAAFAEKRAPKYTGE